MVVTWNGAHLLGPCLESVRAQTEPHRVLVVDNASTDTTSELLANKYAEIGLIRLNSNVGFAGGADAGLTAATTEYVAFLNNDAVAEPGWLAALVAELDRIPQAVAVTSRILLADNGRINNVGGAITRLGAGYDRGYGQPDGPEFQAPADVAAFCGGASAVRAADARRVGGFPTDFFLYYEDTDLSWRLGRAGGRIRYVPTAVVHHRHSATSDRMSRSFAFYNQRNQLLMLLRNAPWSLVAMSVARFAAATAVGAVKSLLPDRAAVPHQARPVHRLQVLTAVVKRVPSALKARRRLSETAVMSRREYARRWLGIEAR